MTVVALSPRADSSHSRRIAILGLTAALCRLIRLERCCLRLRGATDTSREEESSEESRMEVVDDEVVDAELEGGTCGTRH